MKTAFLEVSDAFEKAYALSFYSRRPLVDRCVKAIETESPIVVSCPSKNLQYVEIDRCRVYFACHTLIDIRFV